MPCAMNNPEQILWVISHKFHRMVKGYMIFPRILFALGLICVLGIRLVAPDQPVSARQLTNPLAQPVMVGDLNKGANSLNPQSLLAVGTNLFFNGDDSQYGTELWVSLPPYDKQSTRRITDINPGEGNANPHYLACIGESVFFSATDGREGYELWRIEPPYIEAYQVQEINPAGDADPKFLTAIGNHLFFQATDGSTGFEIWKSSPPYHEALPVADIFEGSESSHPKNLTSIGWTLFFSAEDSSGTEVWKSDPPYNQETTKKISLINPDGKADPEELTPVGMTLFFSADDGERGREVWKIETPYEIYNTALLDNFDEDDCPDEDEECFFIPEFESNPTEFYGIDDTLFFSSNEFSGFEPRKSNPPYDTTSTFRVADIFLGPESSYPHFFYSIGSFLFFSANDGETGVELWKSEPSYIDTTRIADIIQDYDLTLSRRDEARASDIWGYPGVSSPAYIDAVRVADIWQGYGNSNPIRFTAIGTTLYFTANDGIYGEELWQSEFPFNEDSTKIVGDIRRGANGSNPQELTVIDRTLFFRADDGEHGSELWKLGDGYVLPATGFAPGRVTNLSGASKEYQSLNQLRLVVPAMDVDIPLVGVPKSSDGWDLTWLGYQAGYLNGTAFPTTPGNTAITAHAFLADGTAGPFHDLDKLKWGDLVEINSWGNHYIYEVREVMQVSPDETEILGPEEFDWITLITCKEYDESLQGYRWRLVVRAVLVRVD